MKTAIHPTYNFAVIKDAGSNFSILTRSTQSSKESTRWIDGNVYPLITVEVSSASHPFFTGQQRRVGKVGPIETFNRKYADAKAKLSSS